MARRLLFTGVLLLAEAGALMLLASALDGFAISGFGASFVFVAVIAVLNAVLWPLALRLTFPFAFFTLGLFTLLLNALMVWLAGEILASVSVDFWDGILVALVLALVQVVFGALLNEADN